jgi:hypothetical protein
MINEEKWIPNKEEMSAEEYEFYMRTIELFEEAGWKY